MVKNISVWATPFNRLRGVGGPAKVVFFYEDYHQEQSDEVNEKIDLVPFGFSVSYCIVTIKDHLSAPNQHIKELNHSIFSEVRATSPLLQSNAHILVRLNTLVSSMSQE